MKTINIKYYFDSFSDFKSDTEKISKLNTLLFTSELISDAKHHNNSIEDMYYSDFKIR